MNEDQIEGRLQELRDKSKEYAHAKAHVEYLEEFRKSQLAILMKKFEFNFPSAVAQEREARASVEYQTFLEGLQVAVQKAEQLRWSLQIDMAAIEIWRTRRSDRRAEMNLR